MNGSSIMFLINIMWRFVCLQTNIQRMRKSLRISCRILLLSCGRSEKIFSICIRSNLSFILPYVIRLSMNWNILKWYLNMLRK